MFFLGFISKYIGPAKIGAAVKATICDLKGQLQKSEDANSQLQLIQNKEKKTKLSTGLPSFAIFIDEQ